MGVVVIASTPYSLNRYIFHSTYRRLSRYMKFVNPDAEVICTYKQEPLEFIEKVARTCYKSQSSGKSSEQFIGSLIKSKHYAMLEHYHIPVKFSLGQYSKLMYNIEMLSRISGKDLMKYLNKCSMEFRRSCYYLTGSLRAFLELVENCNSSGFDIISSLQSALHEQFPSIFPKADDHTGVNVVSWDKFLKDVNEVCYVPDRREAILMNSLPLSVKFTCDRGVSHELVRHRDASFAQESTRYCNYSTSKFDNEVTFIHPSSGTAESEIVVNLYNQAENAYMSLIQSGASPQVARAVLPNGVKTEIWVTATESEWSHILDLRLVGTTGAPHPDMKTVMKLAYPELVRLSEKRLVKEEYSNESSC